ncbi:MAG: LexA repressor [Microgenomates group bacterium GW2011_GWF2_45_18]|nr:MAG: LexA repressor [Microgenomates group bacterium GW2011_GWF1_44_10]KKU02185.1 MAG: LexA repressor [Microgenomates group bacterium GW2011_GWF2_45_18]OGJ40915.1 MAG: repressor LexA [Candidatus Pacebacteria bacterium RIFOXYB1_FULL_44_10]HAU99321.1 repressor LexA [Candidatus Paceibacterota bacterium]
MAVTLYKRQRQIVDFVSQYIQKNGFSPTLQEIATSLGVSSLATVHEHLQALIKKKIIRKYEGSVRGLELIDRTFLRMSESVDLPILGYIAAGRPIQPYTDPNATFKVSPELVSASKRSYVLQVRGDSMIEDGILDGDFVVIEEVQDANNGEIVVAMLENGLATLKRFFREATRVRLEPANATMQPIYATNVRIQGKVVGLIRRFTN